MGKIAKPVLKRLETADALKTALAQAGVEVCALEVEDDKKLGTVVHVTLDSAGQEAAVRTALGQFPFPLHFETRS